MRGPSTPARREVLAGYLAFYRGHWAEGKVSPCHDPALKSQARRLLGASGGPPLDGDEDEDASRPVLDVAGIAERCLGKAAGGELRPGLVLRNLGKAFEFLELLCVNLFLLPWRKEIKSLKTFTGNFVYYVQSVLPEELVTRLLEEIGYVPTNSTEFSLVKRLNEEDAEQAAFELFLARIGCEELLEMAVDIRDSDLVDMLQKRSQKHWYPERNLAKKHQSTQRKGCVIPRGRNEIEGCLAHQSGYWTHEKPVDGSESTELRSEFVLRCLPAEPQPATSKPTPETNSNQRSQGDAFSTSDAKSSDSEEFLIKYSDIIIGQKPSSSRISLLRHLLIIPRLQDSLGQGWAHSGH
ncbi:hypothetical protein JRQ81_006300 [Phrynocephalus forsythii]|uniref:Spermatogenesis-associated protein 2 PUB-like domain-containing protein n=1 Tax=Phrynocephalus forsythii TaxID=171643 RepID=A0A9Q0XEQ0_9SAUR|nr:hypothetical protein JRQ81_006300 [Phrynocephalus forsythii]